MSCGSPGTAISSSVNQLGQGYFFGWRHVSLTVQAKKDLEVWREFLRYFNGRSMFSQRHWDATSVVDVTTNASGGIGFGAVLQSSWLIGVWSVQLADQSIAVKEMVPVVIAFHTWAARWQGRCVRLISDNLSVVCAVNAQSCRDPKLMGWVRRFFS